MKKQFLFLSFLLITAIGITQPVVQNIYGDTVKFSKRDGTPAEFILLNSTKNVAGFLKNMGNGKTSFVLPTTLSGYSITDFIGTGIVKSTSGTISFLTSLDSVYVPMLHSENYYNTKYLMAVANGLTQSGQTAKIGGTLTENTTINANGKTFKIYNGDTLWLQNDGNEMYIGNSGGNVNIQAANNLKLIAYGTGVSVSNLGSSMVKADANGFLKNAIPSTDYLTFADTGRGNNQIATGGSLTKVKDSLGVVIAGKGTVASVATGLGLSGGTITTNGTLLVDTSSASIISRQRAAATYATIASLGTGAYTDSTKQDLQAITSRGNTTTNLITAKKFEATDTTDNGTPAAAFRINRTLGFGYNTSGHGFRDQTIFNRAAGNAYNAFDGAFSSSGTANIDHLISFQARQANGSSGRVSDFYGGASLMSTSAGNITRAYGWDAWDVEKSGGAVIDTNYGFHVQPLTAGTKNYAFASEGTTPSYMLGKLAIGTRNATYPLHIYSPTLASASEDNLLYVEGDAGRGNFAVTNWGTVYIGQSNGAGGSLGNIYLAEPNSKIGISYAPASSTRFDNYVETTGTPSYAISKRVGGVTTNYAKFYNDNTISFGATAANLNASVAGVNISNPSAASYPSLLLSSNWFTGGSATTTKPQLLIQPTGTTSTAWSTSGTGLGVNAPSGFGGNILDLQLNGTSKFSVTSAGTTNLTGNLLFTDNTYDIGASGATRPRNGYFGTSVITPSLTNSSMTLGSIPFAGTGGLMSQDNSNLFWDNTNKRLGIGINNPTSPLEIATSSGNISLNNYTDGLNGAFPTIYRSTGGIRFGYYPQTTYISGSTVQIGGSGAQISVVNDAIFGNYDNSGNLGSVAKRWANVYIGSTLLVGSSAVAASAIVDFQSTTKGFLPPRMTTTQRDAISSPATMLQVSNTTTATSDTYDGTRWTQDAKILTGSATLDFPSTVAGTSSDLTITVTGAADGNVCNVGVRNDGVTSGITYFAWVSAADTVTVRCINTSTAASDPLSTTYKVFVFKN